MRRGLTLIEILLAMSMLIVLLGIVWSTTSFFSRVETQRIQNTEQHRIVRTWERIFNEDFRSVIQDTEQLDRAVGSENIRHFGVSGTATQLRIDISDYSWRTEGSSELRTIFYEFHPTVGFTRQERDYATLRSVEPPTQIVPEIVGGTFQYFDGNTWHDHWASLDRKSAPSAVRITFYSLSRAEAIRWRSQLPGVREPVMTEMTIDIPAASRAHEPYQRAQPPPPPQPFPPPPPPPPAPPAPPPPATPPPPSPFHSLFGDP